MSWRGGSVPDTQEYWAIAGALPGLEGTTEGSVSRGTRSLPVCSRVSVGQEAGGHNVLLKSGPAWDHPPPGAPWAPGPDAPPSHCREPFS